MLCNLGKFVCSCVCVFSSHPFWTSSSLDVPAGVTQEEGHTGFLVHLPSAVHAFIFLARRIQPFLSLVDHEVEFCVLRPFFTLSFFPIGNCLFPIGRKNPCHTLSEIGNFRSEISDERFSIRILSEMRRISDVRPIESRSSEIV